jgi:UPF0716 protein FxsA
MMRRGVALLPLGLLVLAIAEVVVFVAVAHAIGAGWAVLLLAACSVAGLALLRREGVRGWRALRAATQAGRPAGVQVSDSLVGLLGALLLALPGFLTGVAGLLLIAPPVRGVARRGVEHGTQRRVSSAVAGDLFGPRRVRVRRGDPVTVPDQAGPDQAGPDQAGPDQAGPHGPGRVTAAAALDGEVVEGEIVR